MSGVSRRTFLKASSGAIGACAFGAPLADALAPQSTKKDQRTKIYTVFLHTAPSRDDTDLEPVPNDDIVRRLQEACDGVDFDVRDFTQGASMVSVLNELKDLKKKHYDGVVICGCPRDRDMLRSGLPTINVAVVNDFMNNPYPLYQKNRVVGAFLDPWRFCADASVSEQMLRDLVDKILLIKALKRMKSDRILTVTDSPYVNVIYGDVRKNPPAGS